MITRCSAKVELKQKGWSYRRVAPVLGISFTQLERVLNGRSSNPSLLAAIAALPTFADWKNSHANQN
jgi:transcriptional regulator with XRE-family HTH domain